METSAEASEAAPAVASGKPSEEVPTAASAEPSGVIAEPWAFCFSSDSLGADELQLMERIRGALKLKPEDVKLCFGVAEPTEQNLPHQAVVFFSAARQEELGQWQSATDRVLVKTFSLQHLLQHPEAKQQTWSQLKPFLPQV